MCKSRLILMLIVCVSAIAPGRGAVHADVSQSATALLERAVEYDRSLSTPAEMALEQRRLLAVTLASTELQSTSMSDFLYAFKEASALVTYLPQSDTTYIWQSNAWVPFSRSTYTYVSGNLSQIVGETYDAIEESWVNESRQTFTYSDGQTATILFEYWQVDPAPAHWENSLLITYTYNGTLLTEAVSQTWDSDSESWLDYTRSVSYFTNFKLDSAKGYLNLSQPTNWVQQSLTEYTYIGDLIQTITLNKTNLTTFLYDAAGNLIEEILSFDFFGILQPASRTTYYYTTSGIFDNDAVVGQPAEFDIGQNYPNPFNLSTVIPYSLAGDSHVRITVCNILGQTMSTLVDAFQPAGAHIVLWDGRDANGRDAASGIYFTRVQVGALSQVRKMVLLK